MKFSLLLSVLIVYVLANNAKLIPRAECEVKNVYAAYVGEAVAISWEQVGESCSSNPTYKVQYFIDGILVDTVDSLLPGVPLANIVVGKLTCEKVSFKVLVYDGEAVIGESDTITLERDLEDIVDISTEQTGDGLLIKWKKIDLGESCPITYHIQYTIEGEVQNPVETMESSCLLPVDIATSCTVYEIELVASTNGMQSKPESLAYEIGITAVKDVSLRNDNGRVVVKFKPPQDIPEKCGEVEYMVIQDDKSCFSSDIFVAALSTNGNEGAVVMESIIREPSAVLDLVADPNGDKVYLEWDTPIGGASCNVAYFIYYQDIISSTHSTSFVATLELKSCKVDTITVTPIIIVDQDYVEGMATELALVGDLGPVTNLECSRSSDAVVCTWGKPSKSDLCEKFSYEVSYFDGINSIKKTIEETTYSFKPLAKLCIYWLAVQPAAQVGEDSWTGDLLEAKIDGCE